MKIKAAIQSLPLWLRKAVTDSVEGFVSAFIAMPFVDAITGQPHDPLPAAIVLAATLSIVSAVRRNASDFILWVKDIFGTS